jgi:hypothetical protein
VAPAGDREKRVLAVLSSAPLAIQLLFHVWEQWSLFGGRYAYVDRLARTTGGAPTFAVLVLFVLPMLGWIVLLVRALLRGDRLPGQARPGDPPIARALGAVVRIVSPVAALGIVVHVAFLWGGRIAGGQPPLWSYDLLRTTVGQPAWLAFYALLVTSVTWHLAASLPDGLEALGIVGAEGRRSAFVVTAVMGVCLFILYAQLAGWLATGLGTFWPIRVVAPEGVVSP